jgi:arylsulfatase A-like enzyme
MQRFLENYKRQRGLAISILFFSYFLFLSFGCSGKDPGLNVSDANPPQIISFGLNGDKDKTSSSTITLRLSAEDDTGIAGYFVSESPAEPSIGHFAWKSTGYEASMDEEVAFELSDGYGDKTVYVWVKDTGSNISSSQTTVKRVVVDEKTTSPNIIVIVIDTLRADHLPLWGYERDTAPNITELGDNAVVFKNAIASAPWTYPSYASMLLGKLAFRHSHNSYEKTRIGEGSALPLHIQHKGYATVSIQTNQALEYLDPDFIETFHIFGGDDRDVEAVDKAITWLNGDVNKDRTFFMFMGLLSPHWDYDPQRDYLYDFVTDETYSSSGYKFLALTEGIAYSDLSEEVQACLAEPLSPEGFYEDSRLYAAAYDSEIKFADYNVGLFLDALKTKGLFDDSLIIIMADHGENMTDHTNYFSHGDNLYNSLLHVPLIIKFPGQTDGLVVDEYVRTIDALPTVLDYLGIDVDSLALDGKSLIPVVNGDDVNYGERPVISYLEEAWNHEGMVSVIKDGFKLIKRGDETELYNLSLDPNEQRDISGLDTETTSTLNIYLNQHYNIE